MQAPLVAQLRQVGATNITTLSLLNAVAATMPAAEAAALRRTPGVKAVVPDGTIIIGEGTSATEKSGRLPDTAGGSGWRAANLQLLPEQPAFGA